MRQRVQYLLIFVAELEQLPSLGPEDQVASAAQQWCNQVQLQLAEMDNMFSCTQSKLDKFAQFWGLPGSDDGNIDELLRDLDVFLGEYGNACASL